jgi:hypothetical protein
LLASPLRLPPEEEEGRRGQVFLEIAQKAARSRGLDPDMLESEELARLVTETRKQLYDFSMDELETALLMMK